MAVDEGFGAFKFGFGLWNGGREGGKGGLDLYAVPVAKFTVTPCDKPDELKSLS